MENVQTLKANLQDLIKEYDETGGVMVLVRMVAEIQKNDANHHSDYHGLRNFLLNLPCDMTKANNAITFAWLLSVSDAIPADVRSVIGQASDRIQIYFDRLSLKV